MRKKLEFAGLVIFLTLVLVGMAVLMLADDPEGPSNLVVGNSETVTPSSPVDPPRAPIETQVTDSAPLAEEPPPDEAVPEAPRGASIAGVVVDPAGRPQADVYILFKAFRRADVDAEGRFLISNLEPGEYELAPYPRGARSRLKDREGARVVLVANQQRTGIRLLYDRESPDTISGKVTDVAGQPIAGVALSASRKPGGSSAQFETGQDGLYSLEVAQEEVYTVTAYHMEYATGQKKEVAQGARNVDFVLKARGFVEGRVVDRRTSEPVTEFRIGSSPAGDPMTMTNQGFQDPDGAFRMKWVDPGDVALYVRAKGYAPTRAMVKGVKADSVVQGVVIGLSPGAVLSGRVVDGAGSPVAGARIRLEGQKDVWLATTARSEFDTHDGVADGEGHFELAMLDTAYTGVTAIHSDYPETTALISLSPGETTEVNIAMTGRATVEGTISVNGTPSSRQTVTVFLRDEDRSITVQTDEAGFYQVANLPEGRTDFDVHIKMAGFDKHVRATGTLQLGHATTVDVDVPMGAESITGQITRGGKPYAPEAVFVAIPNGQDNWDSALSGGSLGADGRYLVTGLKPGTHRLVVMLPVGLAGGRNWIAQDVTVNEGEQLSLNIVVPNRD